VVYPNLFRICLANVICLYLFYAQILAMLYKKKQQLLNSHILHLTFSLVGTVDSGKESSIIPNKKAFEDILCDLEVCLLACITQLEEP